MQNGVQCGAMRANGKVCKNTCKPGFTKCHLHGGNSPVAKYKAEERLALLRMPAIEALYTAMNALEHTIHQFLEDTCPTCGYPKGDAEEKDTLIRACRSQAQTVSAILDRTGLGPKSTLEVKQSDGDFDLKSLTEAERERMMALLAQFKALREEVRQRVLTGVTVNSPPASSLTM